MNKFLKSVVSGDRVIRLFLAFFCPPLAVADKGCLLFVPMFLLYLLQITAMGAVLIFGLYAMWWLFFECPLLLQLYSNFGDFYRQAAAWNPDWIAVGVWNTLCVAGCGIVMLFILILIFLVSNFMFGMISSIVNIIFGFVPILIAIMVCLCADEQEVLKPERAFRPIRRNGLFSLPAAGHLFIGVNRIVLCSIYPPLAVADMGWKKMLLVFLFNLLGWTTGVASVLFFVIKKYSSIQADDAEKTEGNAE